MSLLIKNGKVCLSDRVEKTDILIEQGKIAAIGHFKENAANQTIDAAHQYILPGLIDFHVHLDDQMGHYYLADTYKSGSHVAIQNGITTIVSFITQYPSYQTLTDAVKAAYHKANNNLYCDLTWHLTPRDWSEQGWQELDGFLSRGFKTLKLYTTYRPAGIYPDYRTIEAVLKAAKVRNIRVLIHCEDDADLQQEAKQIVNLKKAYSITKLRPKNAEVDAIKRIVEIAIRLQAPVHFVHVSTVEVAQIILQAKKHAPVSCETCPQYLFFNESLLKEKESHRYLCTPPFRDEANQLRLNHLAQKNFFDLFATDHCAFLKKDKDEYQENFLKVPNGLPGLGALLPMINELFKSLLPDYRARKIAYYLSEAPAKLAGLYSRKGCIKKGADADLVLLNFDGDLRKIQSTVSDVYDPYSHFDTSLHIKNMLLSGEIVVRDNQLVDSNKLSGKCLCQI